MRRLETFKKERRNNWSHREQMGKERPKWSRLENRKKKRVVQIYRSCKNKVDSNDLGKS